MEKFRLIWIKLSTYISAFKLMILIHLQPVWTFGPSGAFEAFEAFWSSGTLKAVGTSITSTAVGASGASEAFEAVLPSKTFAAIGASEAFEAGEAVGVSGTFESFGVSGTNFYLNLEWHLLPFVSLTSSVALWYSVRPQTESSNPGWVIPWNPLSHYFRLSIKGWIGG